MNISSPKVLLRIEGFVVLAAACVAYHEIKESWLMFAALFLAPDLSMLGYLFGPRAGSVIYNIAHTYFAPFLLWTLVYLMHWPSLFPVCVIWVAHIGSDRLLGFGLKYPTAFKDTHLSKI
jgi:hypothetical protein